MTLKEGFDRFESRELAGLSERTVQYYKETISRYISFTGTDIPLWAFSMDKVNPYIRSVYESGNSISTKSTYIRAVKIFLCWLEAQDYFHIGASGIRLPRPQKKVVSIYTNDEVRQIISSIRSNSEWQALRNRSIILLMLDSGARLNEICTLKSSNFHSEQHLMKVNGKGNKERIVPFGACTASIIRDYLEKCPYHGSENLFVNSDGGPLTRNAIRLVVEKISRHLPFELSAHRLRHNFATNYILDQYQKNGQIDVYRLKTVMGHSNIETTERYMHFALGYIASRENISHVDEVFLEYPASPWDGWETDGIRK